MKVNDQFLAAKNDKAVSTLCVSRFTRDGIEKQVMYLCIDAKIPYTDKTELVFIETDIEVRIENYSGYSGKTAKVEISDFSFHNNVRRSWDNPNFVSNFLTQIKKDSEVRFKIVAYNSTDLLNELNLVSHQLYGYINDKEYFLHSYTGRNNSASPIKEVSLFAQTA